MKLVYYRLGNVETGKYQDFDDYESAIDFAKKFNFTEPTYQLIKFQKRDLITLNLDPDSPVFTIEGPDKKYYSVIARITDERKFRL